MGKPESNSHELNMLKGKYRHTAAKEEVRKAARPKLAE